MYEQRRLRWRWLRNGYLSPNLGERSTPLDGNKESPARATVFHSGNQFFSSLPPGLPDLDSDKGLLRVNS